MTPGPCEPSSAESREPPTQGRWGDLGKYEGYAKDPAGNFAKSKLVEVSNKVSYTVG